VPAFPANDCHSLPEQQPDERNNHSAAQLSGKSVLSDVSITPKRLLGVPRSMLESLAVAIL
jgi:hypothetical protein